MKRLGLICALVCALTLSITAVFALSVNAADVSEADYSNVFTKGANCEKMVSDYDYNIKGNVGNGVFFEGSGESFSFGYNNKIPAEILTRDLPIINMAPLNGEGYDKISSAEFILRDSENPSVRVGLYFTYAGYINEHNVIYVIGDNNGDYRAVNLGGNGMEYFSGKMFGFAAYSNSLNPEVMYTSLNFSLDYASKTLCYSDPVIREILCMTDRKQVGSGIWNGFPSGYATLEVVINTFKGGKVGVVVQKLFGESVGGKADLSQISPEIYFEKGEYDLTDMPVGGKGIAYPLPVAHAFDRYVGESEVKVVVRCGQNEKEIKNNLLVPEIDGVHTVGYSANNGAGGAETREEISVRVNEYLPQYNVWLGSDDSPVIDEYFDIPEVYVSGGSGTLKYTLSVRYNEKSFGAESGDHIFIGESGVFVLFVTVKGYTGEAYTEGFYYEIAEQNIPFVVSAVPEYALSGEELLLPEPEIKNGGLTVDVSVNGEKLARGEFVVPAEKVNGENLEAEYSSEDGVYKRKYEIKVISPENREDYMIAEIGNPVISLSERRGIEISASRGQTVSARMPFALPLENFMITVITEGNGADSADIILRDAKYGVESFLRVGYNDGESSYVQLNGTGKKVIIDGGFGKNVQISFMINSRENSVYSAKGELLFDDFFVPSGIAYVSFLVNGTEESDFALTVRQVANQLLYASDAQRLVYGEERIATENALHLGGTLDLPSVLLYDVFNTPKKGYAKVTSSSGKEVYSGTAGSVSVEVEEYGFYYLDYFSEKDGKKADASYTFAVSDDVSPVIKSEKGIPSSAKAGEVYMLPEITVTDNVDESPLWYVIVYNPRTGERNAVTDGTYSFSEAGEYRIIVCATDKAGNVANVCVTVTVR